MNYCCVNWKITTINSPIRLHHYILTKSGTWKHYFKFFHQSYIQLFLASQHVINVKRLQRTSASVYFTVSDIKSPKKADIKEIKIGAVVKIVTEREKEQENVSYINQTPMVTFLEHHYFPHLLNKHHHHHHHQYRYHLYH